MGVFDWKHWVVVLLVALMLFGGKRLRNVGSDLGEAIRGFRKSVSEVSEDDLLSDKRKVDVERGEG